MTKPPTFSIFQLSIFMIIQDIYAYGTKTCKFVYSILSKTECPGVMIIETYDHRYSQTWSVFLFSILGIGPEPSELGKLARKNKTLGKVVTFKMLKSTQIMF